MDEQSNLAGRRVLVVEDEMLVSMLVEDILADFGCIVVGPAAKLNDAIKAAGSEEIDVALLDVNLGGARVFPVAHVLAGTRRAVRLRLGLWRPGARSAVSKNGPSCRSRSVPKRSGTCCSPASKAEASRSFAARPSAASIHPPRPLPFRRPACFRSHPRRAPRPGRHRPPRAPGVRRLHRPYART